MEKHPDKTIIGRIEGGFDFLGYNFSPKGLAAARETRKRFVSRATRFYEQEPGEPCDSPARVAIAGWRCKIQLRFQYCNHQPLGRYRISQS